jgi:hypothetical protein
MADGKGYAWGGADGRVAGAPWGGGEVAGGGGAVDEVAGETAGEDGVAGGGGGVGGGGVATEDGARGGAPEVAGGVTPGAGCAPARAPHNKPASAILEAVRSGRRRS